MPTDTEIGHRLLEILYEDHFGGDEGNSNVDDIAKHLDGADVPQVQQVLGNLAAAGLVTSPSGVPKLTTDGIEVVLNDVERRSRAEERREREKEREERRRHREREHRINRSIVGLTLALVLAGGLQAVALNLDYYSDSWRLKLSVLGALVIIGATSLFLLYLHRGGS